MDKLCRICETSPVQVHRFGIVDLVDITILHKAVIYAHKVIRDINDFGLAQPPVVPAIGIHLKPAMITTMQVQWLDTYQLRSLKCEVYRILAGPGRYSHIHLNSKGLSSIDICD